MDINTVSEFNNSILNAQNNLIVILFYKNGCGPCENFKPKYLELSKDKTLKNVNFLKIDINGSNRSDIELMCNLFDTTTNLQLNAKNCKNIKNLQINGVPSVRFVKDKCVLNYGIYGDINELKNIINNFQ